MNILIPTIGSYGDVHPFLGLGRTLRAGGHSVTLIANAMYRPLANRLDLNFVPVGTAEEFQGMARRVDLWHPTRGLAVIAQGVAQLTPQFYRAIVDHLIPGQTVIAASSLVFAARVVQEKLGVPTASVHLSPSLFRTLHDVPLLPPMPMSARSPRWWKKFCFGVADRFVLDRLLAPPLNEFRSTLGLPPAKGIFRDWYHSPELVIAMFPEWFAPAQPDWPPRTHLVGFPLYDEADVTAIPPDLDEFLSAGTPPVVFTPGSAMFHGHEFFISAVQACARLNRRGLLLTRHREQIPANLPPTVKHIVFAPLSLVLSRAAALVHHGGIGTSSQALAAGVPQVVMPMSHDQPDNAARLRKLGVAAVVRPKKFTATTAATALASLLSNPQTAAACANIKQRFIGVDSMATAATLIEALGKTGTPKLPE